VPPERLAQKEAVMALFRRRVKAADVEIHLPISPNELFYTMVRYFAASLRRNGGAAARSRLVVTVGADLEPEDLHRRLPWSRQLGIEWRWLDRGLFRERSYYATAVERFRYRFEAPVVLILDADMLVTAPLDRLVRRVLDSGRFHGLIAHVCPFLEQRQRTGHEWWAYVAARAGLESPALSCEHTGYGLLYQNEEARYCPPYFNLGVLAAPASVMNTIGETIYQEMDHVTACLETVFRCQIGVALALLRQRLPSNCLRFRYNFPNYPVVMDHFPLELENVRILHYLASDTFRKHSDFAGVEQVEAFLQRREVGAVNQRFQQHLLPIHRQILQAAQTRLSA
jgi:hypothetical protein